jgi:hypothetical protein
MGATLDQERENYLVLSIGNLDGSLDELVSTGMEGIYPTLKEAVQAARRSAERYEALPAIIYRCTPIKRAERTAKIIDIALASPKGK